jgi:rubrerythrin
MDVAAGRQVRIVESVCDVYVSFPELERDARDRFHMALHAADRMLGVIVPHLPRGLRAAQPTEFTLLTPQPTADAAREYAETVLAEAATAAGLRPEQLEQAQITKIVPRQRDITGSARRVEAPVGEYRTVEVRDRGQLRALHQGPLGEWVAYLGDDRSRAWAGRSLFGVLSQLFELFELPHGKKEWVLEIVRSLAGRETALGVRYACPCCDYLTLDEPPPDTFATCPVCWWEDDAIQFRDLDYRGGANSPSLREARATFQRCGAKEPRLLEHARAPLAEEQP